jgi:hypothetical protein
LRSHQTSLLSRPSAFFFLTGVGIRTFPTV